MTLGLFWEPISIEHDMGSFHPESPRRAVAVGELLGTFAEDESVLHLPARPATQEELAYVHNPLYIDRVAQTEGTKAPIQLDPDTTACAETWEAALISAGMGIVAVDNVMNGAVDRCFALTRPPGHHAERDHTMGFCFFNNIAIAAEHAVRMHGVKRVAIVDFDVHHGNGTQHHFYARDDIFFVSTHRYPFFPGTGLENETGEGKGKGFTLNIPLQALTDDPVFQSIYTKNVLPAVKEFDPELILVSAGFDAHEDDPLGGLRLKTECYRWLAEQLKALATMTSAQGRLVYFLEGGYDITSLRASVRTTIEVLR
jgi:acetoin utilization deacetylase AcuC-like enzyme